MKTKFLFTAALVAMAFTSCQKNEAGQDAPVQQGQDTYVGMTIQLPASAVSRAFNGDNNATKEESELTSVTVGTWSPGDVAVTYTDLIIGELTNNNDGTYTATKAVKAKTGSNNIIVLANTAVKPTMAQIKGDAFDATVTGIATADQFVMYSDAVNVMADVKFASKEEVEAALSGSLLFTSNKTTVKLRRAAAKVAVTSNLTATDNTGVADGLGNGKLTNIVWNIANQNKQMTVFPKFVTATGNDAADFIASNVNSPFTRLATPNPVPTVALPNSTESAVAASVAYCLENAHGAGPFLENNTTAVQVSATFAPAANKYVSAIAGAVGNLTVTLGATDMTAGATFYVSKVAIGAQAAGTFFLGTAVEAAITGGLVAAADFTKYTGGKCFWAVWINDGAAKPSYGVLRNHMYTMNIKSIKAPGLPAFPDSTDPIAADTWIMVDMTVEKWNAKGMGDIEL